MTDFIGDALPPKRIRVTRGADRKFTLRRTNPDGDPIDWNAQVYLNVRVGSGAPTRVDAVVVDELAVVRLESTLLDTVDDRTQWQAIMSEAGTPTLETPLMVGTFLRQDGATPRA